MKITSKKYEDAVIALERCAKKFPEELKFGNGTGAIGIKSAVVSDILGSIGVDGIE